MHQAPDDSSMKPNAASFARKAASDCTLAFLRARVIL